ncbi:MAG: phage portal protein [Anaerolineae bacterium]|nr:phage portal protein [Anaerolineae bacterium]
MGTKAGLVERALRRVGYVKWRPSSVIHRVESSVWTDPPPVTSPAVDQAAQYAGVYMTSPWVYVAVNRIAEAAALVPFNVVAYGAAHGDHSRAGEVGGGSAGTPPGEVALQDHPFERLLRRPNPLMSRFELIEHTVGNLEIHGNAYWFLAGEPGGLPRELWPLRPDRVSIVPDPQRGVRGYVYEVDGYRVPLDAAEVVHFRRWHPANDYYGLSALEAARLAVESDRAMADWNHRYFGEGLAVPAGIVAIREQVSDADYERLKREWRLAYGGRERKTAFLRGASVEWHNIGLSQHDMDFLNARRFNREEIFQIFGIPVGMFSENATEANALVGERVFIERTLWPKLVRIAEKITTDLLPFYGSNLVGRFDDIRPQDRSAMLEEVRVARGILTVDELRARYFQLGPLPPDDAPSDSLDDAASDPPEPPESPASPNSENPPGSKNPHDPASED